MNTLRNMRVFVRVVEAGSFTAAAQGLQMTVAHASRAVSTLEAHLSTRLLNRTTRRVGLTEAGRRYLSRCEQILESITRAEEEIAPNNLKLEGRLRLHANTSFGQHCILPAIRLFTQRNERVCVDLTLNDQVPDRLEDNFDVSVVISSTKPIGAFQSQYVGTVFDITCASPTYLVGKRVPQRPVDLLHHKCVQTMGYDLSENRWEFHGPDDTETVELEERGIRTSSVDATLSAIKQGLGIGVLPAYAVTESLDSGALVRLLSNYSANERKLFTLTPSARPLESMSKQWLDFMLQELPKTSVRRRVEDLYH